MGRLAADIGQTIPFSCQDWAATKAPYRFLSNNKVEEQNILESHFQATRNRFEATDGSILVLPDTTEFSYQRKAGHKIGFTRRL